MWQTNEAIAAVEEVVKVRAVVDEAAVMAVAVVDMEDMVDAAFEMTIPTAMEEEVHPMGMRHQKL